MFKYIYEDVVSVLEYLPYSLALGIPIAFVLLWIFFRNGEERKKGFSQAVPIVVFAMYLAILLVITFFSRESGSSVGGVDMQLFSTWGINVRNNAFVVENVLLFIPYGFLYSWAFRWGRSIFRCTLFGALTSMLVEYFQLLTERGYFQIDDILTNTLGMMIGALLFWLFVGRKRYI